LCFFFSSRRRHTRFSRDWSSDVCSSDLDLLAKDPETYAFIDSMVVRHRAYLDGDASALASNWAQAYVRLSQQARRAGQGSTAAEIGRAAGRGEGGGAGGAGAGQETASAV